MESKDNWRMNLGNREINFTPQEPIELTSGEQPDMAVVAANLEKMETDMWRLLGSESWGGTAMHDLSDELLAKVHSNPEFVPSCANGYINILTGAIIQFDNPQDVNEQIKGDPSNGEVGFKLMGGKIVDFYQRSPQLSPQAFINIKKTIEQYNLDNAKE